MNTISIEETTTEELTKEHNELYEDIIHSLGDNKTNLQLILLIENELTKREANV